MVPTPAAGSQGPNLYATAEQRCAQRLDTRGVMRNQQMLGAVLQRGAHPLAMAVRLLRPNAALTRDHQGPSFCSSRSAAARRRAFICDLEYFRSASRAFILHADRVRETVGRTATLTTGC